MKHIATLVAFLSLCVIAEAQTAAPPAGKITWMYLNGVKQLAGDFTQNGTKVRYNNSTSDGYNGGKKDILFTSTAPWGLFLPYWASNYSLPNHGYTYFLISIKPSQDDEEFGIHAEKTGDVDPNCHIKLAGQTTTQYGPKPVKGVWGSYKVPLSDLCIAGEKALYKIAIATQTSTVPESWEMDAIGFQ